jgi:hypothetical protein
MMNERIKEIAKQARLIYLYDYDADGHAMVCSEKDIKKFAELIVRECADFVSSKAGLQSGLGIKTMLKVTGEQLKEHFGVEE